MKKAFWATICCVIVSVVGFCSRDKDRDNPLNYSGHSKQFVEINKKNAQKSKADTNEETEEVEINEKAVLEGWIGHCPWVEWQV